MAEHHGLNYGRLMQRALRGLMSEVLGIVAEQGLPGEHHFYITIDTTHAGVVMADWLRARYPKELTIVLQHEYEDLAVLSDRFQVRLSFSNRFETLVIPFAAVQTFIDPSVKFGLKFDEEGEDEEGDVGAGSFGLIGDSATEAHAEPSGPEEPDDDPDGPDGPGGGSRESADVVSLDRFRKS